MVTYRREDGYEMFHHVPENGIDLELLIRDAMVALDDAMVTRLCHELVLAMYYPPEEQHNGTC